MPEYLAFYKPFEVLSNLPTLRQETLKEYIPVTGVYSGWPD